MNMRSKLNNLHGRINELHNENDGTIFVRTGVCQVDEEGNYISGGTLTRVDRDQANSFGVLAIPEPLSRDEWELKAAQQQGKDNYE